MRQESLLCNVLSMIRMICILSPPEAPAKQLNPSCRCCLPCHLNVLHSTHLVHDAHRDQQLWHVQDVAVHDVWRRRFHFAVVLQVRQLFRRVPAPTFADSHEQRFQLFTTQVRFLRTSHSTCEPFTP